MNRWTKGGSGFTIVELLIVVVVIAILAAVTVVAYTGIQDQARQSALSSSVQQAAKKLGVYSALNADTYPTQATFSTETGLSDSPAVSYNYYASTNQKSYCVSASDPIRVDFGYALTQSSGTLTPGRCVQNLEPNPSSETATIASAGAGSNTRTLSTAQKYSGTYSTQFVWGSASSGIQSSTITVQPLTTYFVSIYIYGGSGALPVFYVAASDYATNSMTLNGTSATGSWQRLYRTYTTAAGQTTMRIWTTVGSASTFYADAIMITQLSSGTPAYADGSSSQWLWGGTANASTSFGPTVITP